MSENDTQRQLRERLTQLEEHAAFADRNREALHEEVLVLNRRLAGAVERLDRLEARIERLVESQRASGDGGQDEQAAGQASDAEPGEPEAGWS